MLQDREILLVITGGIAAYKSLELIRRLRDRGARVRCVLTRAAENFVTPLTVAALTDQPPGRDLFNPAEETQIGHIRLGRQTDLIIVAPATADVMAKMALGLADELATAMLLAAGDKPILIAPAMNSRMWDHAATQANLATLLARGVRVVPPGTGALAEGEVGVGRMAEVPDIVTAAEAVFAAGPLAGRKALVTSGPTREPIDPVRYISNHSSGKQGHAIAAALARLGADVTLVSGPVSIPDPKGVQVVKVETARQMLAACQAALPADVAVCAAAVADWTVAEPAPQKTKKAEGKAPPQISLVPNPDILATLSAAGTARPRLVVGFAAETETVTAHAQAKLARKGCDWIMANDVSPATGTFGGDHNTVHLVSAAGVEDWPTLTKDQVADRLAQTIAAHLEKTL